MRNCFLLFFVLIFSFDGFSFKHDSTKIKEANRKKMLELQKMLDYTKIGSRAPDFCFISYKGDSVRLSSFRGKVVVLDFWAMWCPPCIKQFSYFDSLKTKFKSEDVVFISISIDKSKKNWENFVKKKNLSDIQLWAAQSLKAYYYTLMDFKTMERADPASANSSEGQKMLNSGVYIVDGVPGNFVIIDREGIIRNNWLLPSDGDIMEKELKLLLK